MTHGRPLVVLAFAGCATALALQAPAPAAQAPAPTAQTPAPAAQAPAAPATVAEQLESLLSPIALFPDPLLGQVLEASTRPDQVFEAAKWSKAHPGLSGKDLESALAGQPWDAPVKALATFPDVLSMMAEHPDWTRQLGETYRSQRDGVLFAVQQLRTRALEAGNLKSSSHQTVKVEPLPQGAADGGTDAPTTIIRIEPANPQVVYVPVYSPTVVYGTWAYPTYPPPPVYPPGYVAGTALVSFSIGFAIGSSYWRYPPYPPYPPYRPYPPRPPPARPPAGGGTQPPRPGGPGGPGGVGGVGNPGGPGAPGGPSQLPSGPGASKPGGPGGVGGVGGPGAPGGPSAGQLPTGSRPSAPTGPSVGQQPAGSRPSGPTAPSGARPGTMPTSGGDRGWGGTGPSGGASRPPGGNALGGMNSGSQTRAASSRGNSSFGGGGGPGGGGRRR